jgi:predicted peptidase
MVLFMGDASTVGSNPTRALISSFGATVWATPYEQAKHECIVVVPQYDTGTPVVNDKWQAT